MAKGDKQATNATINFQGNQAQNELSNTRQRLRAFQEPAFNNAMNANAMAIPDYNTIMSNYRQFMNPQLTMHPMGGNQPAPTDRAGTDPNAPPATPQTSSNGIVTVGEQFNPELAQQAWNAAYPGRQMDMNYWQSKWPELVARGKELGDPQYAEKRLMGWQGTGNDAALAGPFAGGQGGINKSNTGDPFYDSIINSIGGYGNFADTGGFSPQDVANMRARMISPIRGVYSQAQSNIDRAKRLSGSVGSPGYTAATAKLSRDLAYGLADKTTDAEAAIAQMIQQGKLAGLGGMAATGGAARGQNLSALSGQSNLFGTSPGLAREFGSQALQSQGQDLQGQQLQQSLADSIMRARLSQANVPGDFQQGLGNIAGVLGLLGKGAGLLSGLGLGGGAGALAGGGSYLPMTSGDFGTEDWYNH